ncbi:MAG: SdrD B-like domain-containing protein [Pirellulaceae bacterium]
MSNSTLLETAYANHTSAVSTLEMIGWKDSDADGVFDVLDVPLTLTGSGSYDSAAGKFRFQGYSSVQTLPNRNSSGAGNDITLNKVSRAEYRIDGGPWQMAAEYETWGADLDLEFAVPASASSVEIRTIDRVTGITSPVFETNLSGAAGVPLPGLNGVVWEDQDRDGAYDAAEPGVSGVTVRLVDTAGQPIQVQARVEPDNYAAGTRINSSTAGVTLSAIGVGVSDNTVAAQPANSASTGTRVFASFSSACGGFCTEWNSATRQLRIDLSSPASVVQLDAIGASLPGYGRLEIYNATGQLLGRYTTQQLATGAIETMVLTRAEGDIQYAIARSHADSLIRFDNLRIGAEASAVTDANGAYSLAFIGAGSYRVQVVPGAGQSATVPASAIHAVALAAGEARTNVNFGIASDPSRWQNPVLKFDVNGDGALSPIDALVVINNLNQLGSRALGPSDPTPPYLDVNGDSQVSPIDVLQIVNELNRENMGGEAESPPDSFTALSSVTEVDSLPASEGEASPHETRESLPWVQFGAGALVAEGPSSIPVAQREPRRAAADTARTLEESSATAAVALPAGSARTVRHDGTPDPGFATFAAGGLDEDLDALLDILAVDGRCGIPL